MDLDHATAFAKHFKDDSFTVHHGEDHYGDAILWLSFYPTDGSMNMAVYDGDAKAYSHQFKSTRVEDVAGFIAQIEADYAVEIPAHFQKLSEEFLALAGGSFGISEDIYLEASDCEYCGIDYGRIEAFYFPPLEPGGSASLAVADTYGCYGDRSIFGDPRDQHVWDEAVEILSLSVKHGDDESAVARVKDFLEELKRTVAM